jgi:hypothetical protein
MLHEFADRIQLCPRLRSVAPFILKDFFIATALIYKFAWVLGTDL